MNDPAGPGLIRGKPAIVISSAGPNGLIQLGMLAALVESAYFSIDTIQSIYALKIHKYRWLL